MTKRFIILIDFSEYSSNLIKYACDWSKQVKAEILLIHQTTVLAPALTDNESRQHIAQLANDEALQKLKSLAKELIPNTFMVSYSVSESHLQFVLQKFLAEPFENLIFVGLKGTGLLKKIFLGSVALRVIDNTNNTVVAMPKEIDTFSHKKIFVAVTEKHPFSILELNNFLKFIDNQNTNITFFYLAKPNEKTIGIAKQLRELSEMFADRFDTDFAIFEGHNSFDDIKKVISNKTDEMLIVQKGSRHLTDQFFRKFLINDLIYEGRTPLIILP
ncbi:MAG: universal stress protein [Candidatus Scalindua sp.]|nr:universal stress protein [Candidatus Scalindua sp.]